MSRISRNQLLMEVAFLMARRSTCLRLQVGAVLSRDGRILGSGYAGAPSGLPHCSPLTCNTHSPCTRTVHAEQGAIAFAARYGVALDGATLYVTHSPCAECAKSIINSGILNVYYGVPYRKTEGLDMLTEAGVGVYQLMPGEPHGSEANN